MLMSQGIVKYNFEYRALAKIEQLLKEMGMKLSEESKSFVTSNEHDLMSSEESIAITYNNIKSTLVIWFIGITFATSIFLIEVEISHKYIITLCLCIKSILILLYVRFCTLTVICYCKIINLYCMFRLFGRNKAYKLITFIQLKLTQN